MLTKARPIIMSPVRGFIIPMMHIDTNRCGAFLMLFPYRYPESLDQAETIEEAARIMEPFGPFPVGLGDIDRGINCLKIYADITEALRNVIWNTPDGVRGYLQSHDGRYVLEIDCV